MIRARFLALLAALLALASSAAATTVLRLSEEDLLRGAALVVRGEVVEKSYRETPDAVVTAVTDVRLRVDEVMKGEAGATLTIEVPGGRIGERGLAVIGAPVFEVGDKVLLALDKDAQGELRVRGLHQGRFTVLRDLKGQWEATQDPWRELAAKPPKLPTGGSDRAYSRQEICNILRGLK